MNNTRCSCGRRKYFDAVCCDKCWKKGKAYDEREPKGIGSWTCSCGNTKEALDASMCSECWDRQSVWDDR